MVRRQASVLVLTSLLGGAAFVGSPDAADAAPKAGKAAKAEPVVDAGPKPEDVGAQARTVYDDLAGSSDPRVRVAAFEGRLSLAEAGGKVGTKDDRAKALASGLEDSFAPLRDRAIALALSDLKDKKTYDAAFAAVVKLLASSDADERDRGLVFIDGPKAVVAAAQQGVALARAEVDGAPETRVWVRAQIAKRGGKPAWDTLAKLLAEPQDGKDFAEGLALFANYAEPLGVSWGLTHVHDRDALGVAVRAYLVRVQDPKAGAEISKVLGKAYEKAEFAQRIDAASVLSQRGLGNAAMAKSLSKGARFNDASVRLVALDGLRGVRDLAVLGELRDRITNNETQDEVTRTFAWLEAWVKATGEKAVVDLLQELARSDRRPLRLEALGALTGIRHRPSAPLFEASMREGQVEIRLAAARGLAAVAKPGDEARLGEMLRKEPDVQVKKALVEALSAIGTAEIIDPLQFHITAPQLELKRAAVDAVARTGSPRAITLVALLKRDPDVDLRFAAWQHLFALDPKGTLKEFKTTLGWLGTQHVIDLGKNPKVPVEALEVLALDGSDTQRGFAVDALAERGEAAATRLLSIAERSTDDDTAGAALVALAGLRKETSLATYREFTKSQHGKVRAAAFDAVGLYGPKASLDLLLPGLSDKEPMARARAARASVLVALRKE
jgi:HEAT repeat protein